MRTKDKKRTRRLYKQTRVNLRIIFMTAVAICLGLLFYCIISEAADYDFMPKAGWEEMIEEIPVEPIYIEEEPEYEHPHELFDEPIAPNYILTDHEAELLLQIGVLEGGEVDPESIANVMQVVMNRVESDSFPNSVEEVIFQDNPKQFTTADKLATANITPEAYAALDQVIFGDYTENDTHFFESCEGLIFSGWAEYAFSYGGHDFYKVKEG